MLRASGSHLRVVAGAGPGAFEDKRLKKGCRPRGHLKTFLPVLLLAKLPQKAPVPLPADSYAPIPSVLSYSTASYSCLLLNFM